MATNIKISASSKKKEDFNQAIKKIKVLFNKIEKSLSSYDKTSELSFINQNAHKHPIKCSEIFWDNLIIAEKAYYLSDGFFDITIESFLRLWGLKYFKRKTLPTREEIQKTLKITGFDKLILNHKEKTIFFTKEGVKLNFGGLTKGYAIDQAIAILKKFHCTKIFVNFGGNIRTTSTKKVGIINPAPKQKNIFLKLENSSISTSGNYQRYITIANKRYSHIINPKTGYPIKGISSISIITSKAVWADILSTMFFISYKQYDKQQIENLLKRLRIKEALFIDDKPNYKTYHWKKIDEDI